ncbi:MAG: phospholipid/cholesterol/gamma-HCH transport system substrate-binding protein [Thermoleophilaceae bacterium]|nr:phospholipid/cholesterol/gamma-HCH transport system substrate-binding protein [Thermoleophilaceae bacterium]
MIIAIAAVLFVWWVIGTRTQAHTIKAGFTSAVQLFPGLDVRVDGIDAGKVGKISYVDGVSVVEIGISDERVWPLHQGTRAVARWGTTVGNGTRFIELDPGPDSAPAIADGGIIPTDNTVSAVEFDDLFNTFNADTRESFQTMLANTGGTVVGHEKGLASGLEESPEAFEAAGGVFHELAQDEYSLQRLVSDTSNTASILANNSDAIRNVVAGAAQTFDAFGSNSADLRTDIAEFPETLRQSRTTLSRFDSSINELNGLMNDLKPGAQQLRPLAAQMRPALSQLRHTAPNALSTVRTITNSAPDITAMLRRGAPFSRDIDPLFKNLAPMIGCFRPYAPEFAGFLSNWASFSQNYDSVSHYARVRGSSGAIMNNLYPPGFTTKAFTDLSGDHYAYPRVPGVDAGNPQFIEKCGYTPDSLDPSKDPEDARDAAK